MGKVTATLAGATRRGAAALAASMVPTASPVRETTARPNMPPVMAIPVTRFVMEERAATGIL